MEYGYVRVSSRDQNIARQMDEMARFGIPEARIFVDRQSGKNFERSGYRRLIKRLREGDVFVVKSIDRLGRDYQMIIDEWRRITKTIRADIVVLDMPVLDTRENGRHGLVGKFIGDLVLQILSFVAQNERENIRERQAEGIRLAKERGSASGARRKSPPSCPETIARFSAHEITGRDAAKLIGVSKTTFFRLVSNEKNPCVLSEKKAQKKAIKRND